MTKEIPSWHPAAIPGPEADHDRCHHHQRPDPFRAEGHSNWCKPGLQSLEAYDRVFITAMTASELLFGVRRTQGETRRIRSAAFVESVLAALPILDFDLEAACIHAEVTLDLHRRGETLGANDLVIAAIAWSTLA